MGRQVGQKIAQKIGYPLQMAPYLLLSPKLQMILSKERTEITFESQNEMIDTLNFSDMRFKITVI